MHDSYAAAILLRRFFDHPEECLLVSPSKSKAAQDTPSKRQAAQDEGDLQPGLEPIESELTPADKLRKARAQRMLQRQSAPSKKHSGAETSVNDTAQPVASSSTFQRSQAETTSIGRTQRLPKVQPAAVAAALEDGVSDQAASRPSKSASDLKRRNPQELRRAQQQRVPGPARASDEASAKSAATQSKLSASRKRGQPELREVRTQPASAGDESTAAVTASSSQPSRATERSELQDLHMAQTQRRPAKDKLAAVVSQQPSKPSQTGDLPARIARTQRVPGAASVQSQASASDSQKQMNPSHARKLSQATRLQSAQAQRMRRPLSSSDKASADVSQRPSKLPAAVKRTQELVEAEELQNARTQRWRKPVSVSKRAQDQTGTRVASLTVKSPFSAKQSLADKQRQAQPQRMVKQSGMSTARASPDRASASAAATAVKSPFATKPSQAPKLRKAHTQRVRPQRQPAPSDSQTDGNMQLMPKPSVNNTPAVKRSTPAIKRSPWERMRDAPSEVDAEIEELKRLIQDI